MRTLLLEEINIVSGGADETPSNPNSNSANQIIGTIGLVFSIPAIVCGAALALPTFGLSFYLLGKGIIGTALAVSIMNS